MGNNVNTYTTAAQDMSASFTTIALHVGRSDRIAIQAVMTGSPVGTLVLQVSNSSTTDFVDLSETNNDTTFAVSASGAKLWNVWAMSFNYIRVKYTATSGTGSFTARVHGIHNST